MDVAETRDDDGPPCNGSNSTANADIEMAGGYDPGAYIVPFAVNGQHRQRLDSLSDTYRAWGVNKLRSDNSWYEAFTEANTRYEESLFQKREPGEYPIPFGEHEGQRLDAVPDSLRYWAIHPKRASTVWYPIFVKENERYEEHLAMTREPGMFPFPWGEYKDRPLKDVPQDNVWWALHPEHRKYTWYERLKDANKRYLDEVYSHRSPGSELIWFGQRYKGYALSDVYHRPRFIDFCLDPAKQNCKFYWRLKDLIARYEARLEVSRTKQQPKTRRQRGVIQNPCGEPIGPWDDDQGSAGGSDDNYEEDGFLVSDHGPIEYESDHNKDKDDENEGESDEGSDYESVTDFIGDEDEDTAEPNVNSQELLSDIEDDMPLDELQVSLKKEKVKYKQEADSDGWDSPSPSPRKLTRLKKKPSQGM